MNLFQKYLRNTKGATAIEFAMVAVPLFSGIFACIEVSYKSLLQSELDNKLYEVVYDIGINDHDADTAAEFMRDHFCPNIGTSFLRCDEVEIGVRRVTGASRLVTFRDSSVIGSWELGTPDDTLIIELNYPVTNIIHPVAVADIFTRNGERYYRSRGVTRREPLLTSLAP